MLRLLKGLVVLAAIALIVAFVPISGRTLRQRWSAARGPGDFASRCWAEAREAGSRLLGGAPARATAHRSPAAAPRPPEARERPPGARSTPVEHHTERDRSELDAIVAEHVK
jgi:hypothetical protein